MKLLTGPEQALEVTHLYSSRILIFFLTPSCGSSDLCFPCKIALTMSSLDITIQEQQSNNYSISEALHGVREQQEYHIEIKIEHRSIFSSCVRNFGQSKPGGNRKN